MVFVWPKLCSSFGSGYCIFVKVNSPEAVYFTTDQNLMSKGFCDSGSRCAVCAKVEGSG